MRHNLSLNKSFVRVPRPAQEKGKGAYWTLSQDHDKTKGGVKRNNNRKREQHFQEMKLHDHAATLEFPSASSAEYSPLSTTTTTTSAIPLYSSAAHNDYYSDNMHFDTASSLFPFMQYNEEEMTTTTTTTTTLSSQHNHHSMHHHLNHHLNHEGVGTADDDIIYQKNDSFYDQFERMLAMEQMRQSSQTSIETSFSTSFEGGVSSSSDVYPLCYALEDSTSSSMTLDKDPSAFYYQNLSPHLGMEASEYLAELLPLTQSYPPAVESFWSTSFMEDLTSD